MAEYKSASRRLYSLRKNIVLKGHGFNRAERATEEMAALAAEAVSWRDRSLSNRVEHVV
jgi:hypothetical protein